MSLLTPPMSGAPLLRTFSWQAITLSRKSAARPAQRIRRKVSHPHPPGFTLNPLWSWSWSWSWSLNVGRGRGSRVVGRGSWVAGRKISLSFLSRSMAAPG